MQNIAARYNPYIFLDRNRERTVVYYGRVSTEHEAQLAALENQLQWYDDQTERHSNWNVLQKYIDEGITGTQAKKRPAFLRMLEDARAGKFDLIVTREVCRFARNTVDTLVTTRELKNLGIEVYFVEDNIWTMDGDGELRLTIMATLAQEESRKVSERVRAGQKISRENGVLYGNGNIIGYDRVGSTYVINEEQAETVRIIFDLYLQGAGQTKIAKELCRLGRKDGHGQVSWSASKIGRILHNATYKGYNCYLKSFSNNYLEQKRIKNLDEETYMYVKGDFEPIVSEEIWDKCSEIRKARTTKMIVNKGERTYGKKSTQDVWLRKLRCSCGSTFRKNKWRTNKRGDEVFGYQCYNQVNNGSKAFREKNGLDTEGYCDIRMVGDWKLEIMAKKIFEGIWTEQERKDAILEVYRLLNEYYQSDTKNNQAAASALEGKIARLKNKIDNLISMRADGEITKEEFKSLKDTTEAELNKYMEEKARMSELSNSESGMEFDTEKIRAVLEEALDFSKPKLDDSIIEKFVSQIIPVDNCRYRWDLNFLPNETQSLVCKVEGRKNHADATIEEGSEDEDESPRTYVLSMDYSNISVTAKNAYQSYVLHRQQLQARKQTNCISLKMTPCSSEQGVLLPAENLDQMLLVVDFPEEIPYNGCQRNGEGEIESVSLPNRPMAVVFLLLLFCRMGLGICLCICKEKEVGEPWIHAGTFSAYLWYRRHRDPVGYHSSERSPVACLFDGNGGGDGAGIHYRCLHGKAFPCEILGLQQKAAESERAYLPGSFIGLGSLFCSAGRSHPCACGASHFSNPPDVV